MLGTLQTTIVKASSVATMNYFREAINGGITKALLCASTSIIGWLSAFFAPLWILFLSMGIFIGLDTALGVSVSKKNGFAFESRKMWSTIRKFGYCVIVVTCAHILDEIVIPSIDLHLVEAFAGMVCGVELWSMLENLCTLDPTGPWKIFKKFVKQKGEKYLEITIDKDDLPKVKKICKKIK